VTGDTAILQISVRDYNSGYFIVGYQDTTATFQATTPQIAFTVKSFLGWLGGGFEGYSLLVTPLTGGLPPTTPTPTPTVTRTRTPTPSVTKTNTPTLPIIEWDANALNYVQTVEAADGQSLEPQIRVAINNFVKGLKSDNVWNNISAACILVGARTLSGALVPLKGPAPTNYNFTSSDYHRSTGLLGNGLEKYLDSNLSLRTLPISSRHMSFYVSDLATDKESIWNPSLHYLIYSSENHEYFNTPDSCTILATVTTLDGIYFNLNTTANGYRPIQVVGISPQLGLYGASTDADPTFWNVKFPWEDYQDEHGLEYRENPADVPTYIFGDGFPENGLGAKLRSTWYSLGVSANLSAINARVSTLNQAIEAVVPRLPLPTPTPTPTVTPTRLPTYSSNALYTANSIPLDVTVSDNKFAFTYFGTNNPTLTCYRGANYDFNVNTSSFPFALRNNLNSTTDVDGSFNNNPVIGTSTNVILFTPTSTTPNVIYYQCTNNSSLSGVIQIQD
jgi:hypothetical protein